MTQHADIATDVSQREQRWPRYSATRTQVPLVRVQPDCAATREDLDCFIGTELRIELRIDLSQKLVDLARGQNRYERLFGHFGLPLVAVRSQHEARRLCLGPRRKHKGRLFFNRPGASSI